MTDDSIRTTLIVLLTVVGMTVAGFAAGAGHGGASHGAENGNYTVVFPDETPAPGAEGVSINHYSASTQEQFDEMGAPNHVNMSFIVVSSSEVDFSDCSTEDTRAFGIDRGNDNSGTEYDEDLLKHREDSHFRDNSIIVDFFEGDELAAAGDSPPTLYPVDEIVAAQDSCYKMPDQKGWYQIQGYMNGTNSDGDYVEVSIPSHYFYVCDCENEQEARNELGPPPSEQDGDGGGGGDDTATPTETAAGGDGGDGGDSGDSGDGDDGGGADDGGGGDGAGAGDEGGGGDGAGGDGAATTATPTETVGGAGDGATPTETATEGVDTDETDGDGAGAENATPTQGSGPGLGAVVALVALLAAALLGIRQTN